jgi:hypothetical protein
VVLFTPEQRTTLFVTKVLNQAKVTIRHYSDSLLVTSGNADQVKIMQIAWRQRAIERLCVYDGRRRITSPANSFPTFGYLVRLRRFADRAPSLVHSAGKTTTMIGAFDGFQLHP